LRDVVVWFNSKLSLKKGQIGRRDLVATHAYGVARQSAGLIARQPSAKVKTQGRSMAIAQ